MANKLTEEEPDVESMERNGNSFRFYLTIVFSCIGGLLFGYDTGIISGAMLLMKTEFNLSVFEQSTIVSVTILGAWMFSLLSGWSSERFGRKITILISSIVFTIGSTLMAFAYSSSFLIIGRFILGIAIGFSSSIICVYIAEISQYHQRGTLVTTNNVLTTGGQFVSGLIAGIFSTHSYGWRFMIGSAAIPSALQAVYFLFAPESPRYLLKMGREKEAYQCLKSLRKNEALTQIEFQQIKLHLQKADRVEIEQSEKTSVIEVCKQIRTNVPLRRAVFLGCALQIIQQLAGINTIMYYSATIIEMAGVADKSQAIWLSSITSCANFLFTFVGLAFVERLGRRKLILFSISGVCVSLLFLSGSFYFARQTSPLVTDHLDYNSSCSTLSSCAKCVEIEECGFCFTKNNFQTTCLPVNKYDSKYSSVGWCSKAFNKSRFEQNNQPVYTTSSCPGGYAFLIIVGLVFYLLSFASGLGCIPWTYNSEIFPMKYRSACFSLTVSMNWISNTFISLTFLTFIQIFTEAGTFLMYFFFASIGLVYFYYDLPETKGKKLEEIEKLFEPKLKTQSHSKLNES